MSHPRIAPAGRHKRNPASVGDPIAQKQVFHAQLVLPQRRPEQAGGDVHYRDNAVVGHAGGADHA